jgi:NAD(P)H-dependent flavin oxidoreductase YrpB (nitropropane dioxygenase family)
MFNQSKDVCKILNTSTQIFQAPMNWLTDTRLVSAVSNHSFNPN